MGLQELIGEYALVSKVNVSHLVNSVDWYESKLNLVPDPRFDTPTWAQLKIPEIPHTWVGLNLDAQNVGTKGATLTFVVDDIAMARQALLDEGVDVGDIIDVGHGVLLAFFSDPDGNGLGLRQNSSDHPLAAQLGAK